MYKFYHSKKQFLGLGLILVFIIFGSFFITEKLDENAICWSTASVLTDDELYAKAMRSYIQIALDFRDDLNSMGRSCHAIDKGCGVWFASAHDTAEVKKQIELLMGHRIERYEKVLGIKSANLKDDAVSYKQSNNNFLYLHNLTRKTEIVPSDCCSIATAKEVAFLKDEPYVYVWIKSPDFNELALTKTRFLKVKKYVLYEPHHFTSESEFQKAIDVVSYSTHFYAVNACGEVSTSFSADLTGG